MTEVNNLVIILVFIVILCISAVTAWLINPCDYEHSRWRIFIITVVALGILLTFAFQYSGIDMQMRQKKLIELQESERISNDMDEINKIIEEGSKKSPEFIEELLVLEIVDSPTSSSSSSGCVAPTECTTPAGCVAHIRKKCRTTYNYRLSLSIFSLWDVIVHKKRFIKKDDGAHLTLFLQWCRSSTLKTYWL